ncbi:MAG: hypothetical protein WC880_04640 [Candidatus Paceibacterota bacterium]
MDNEDQVLKELKAIREQLQILVVDKADVLRERIESEHLKTANQKKMYSYFDGKRNLEAIAQKAGVSGEAVRLLVVALEQKGLIRVEKQGKQSIPKRLL